MIIICVTSFKDDHMPLHKKISLVMFKEVIQFRTFVDVDILGQF